MTNASPDTGAFTPQDIAEQTGQSMVNIMFAKHDNKVGLADVDFIKARAEENPGFFSKVIEQSEPQEWLKTINEAEDKGVIIQAMKDSLDALGYTEPGLALRKKFQEVVGLGMMDKFGEKKTLDLLGDEYPKGGELVSMMSPDLALQQSAKAVSELQNMSVDQLTDLLKTQGNINKIMGAIGSQGIFAESSGLVQKVRDAVRNLPTENKELGDTLTKYLDDNYGRDERPL